MIVSVKNKVLSSKPVQSDRKMIALLTLNMYVCGLKKFKYLLVFIICISIFGIVNNKKVYSQSPSCDPNTPFFIVDLSSDVYGVWETHEIRRQGHCCDASGNDRCIEFLVYLHPDAAGVNFQIIAGAIPPGSLYYQIDCGPQTIVGNPNCVLSNEPFKLTFCKPGNNANSYRISSLPKPMITPVEIASMNCDAQITSTGFVGGSVSWSDITGGGQYNSYLSCTNCPEPQVTPCQNAPLYVDYQVCGTPVARCFSSGQHCDTTRVYFYNPLDVTVTPNPAYIYEEGVMLYSNVTGGVKPILYEWYNEQDPSGMPVSTEPYFYATADGSYTLIVYDSLSQRCSPIFVNLDVGYLTLPIQLLSYEISCSDDDIKIEWVSASEINNDYYTVERSTDAIEWNNVAQIKGRGNANTPTTYSYLDKDAANMNYFYKVSQTDLNGESAEVFVDKSYCDFEQKYTEPHMWIDENNNLCLHFYSPSNQAATLILSTMHGIVIEEFTYNAVRGTNYMQQPLSLKNNVLYIANLRAYEIHSSKKVMLKN